MVKIISGYQTDIRPAFDVLIEVEFETTQFVIPGVARNAELPTDVDLQVTAYANHHRSGSGIRARGVYLRWLTEAPEGYTPNGRIWIPILRRNFYRDMRPGMIGTYLDKSVQVLKLRPEQIN
jgi:hypothetical protein